MKFLILGANFQNKGAQAMLFTTTSELMRYFPGSNILFMTREKPEDGYEFTYLYDPVGWNCLKGGLKVAKSIAKIGYLKLIGQKNVIVKENKKSILK